MKEFFNMGGYALYVWGSFGMTALLYDCRTHTCSTQTKSHTAASFTACTQ